MSFPIHRVAPQPPHFVLPEMPNLAANNSTSIMQELRHIVEASAAPASQINDPFQAAVTPTIIKTMPPIEDLLSDLENRLSNLDCQQDKLFKKIEDFSVFNSYASLLIFKTTLYRNQEGIVNKVIAQAAYIFTTVVAVVESIAASLFLILSLAFCPYSSKPFNYTTTWLSSSSFCIPWSVTDFFLNPFIAKLEANEENAYQLFRDRMISACQVPG